MIAAVAAWAIAFGPAAATQPAPTPEPSRDVAAQVKALIRKNTGNTELVTFADRRQVKVVRGKKKPPGPATARGADEIIAFFDQQLEPVRIMRGAPAAAAASVAVLAEPERRPTGADVQVVSFTDRQERPVTVLRGSPVMGVDLRPATAARNLVLDLFAAADGADLDRVAFAVDGAESSHGADAGMWRSELSGPQGPMQVSAAAASDSGGGDRFDLVQNRLLGRAYLARLNRRYGDWPDAVAAYNWGPGNMDAWIARGRPPAGLPLEVERYCDRVLGDGGIVQRPEAPLSRTGWQLPMP